MKKRIAFFLTCFVSLITIVVIFLAACDNTQIGKYYDKISDYRNVALRLTDDRYYLDVIGGVRETPYELDGKCAENKTDYVVFTLRPRGDFAAGEETLPLSVVVAGTEYRLELKRHPFKNSYSAEIAASLGESCASLDLTVCGESVSVPACIADGIDGETALSVALDAVADRKKSWEDYEIYLRLSENTVTAAGGWYWYVAFRHGDDTDSVLINAATGEIAAVRN